MAQNAHNKDFQSHSLHAPATHFTSLVNREGRVNIHGHHNGRQNPLSDIYHYLFSLSWSKFFIHIAAVYFTVNLVFSCLYFLDGVDMAGKQSTAIERFGHCFFLSVENMSAVEYARIEQVNPGTYVLMILQAFLGVLTLAVITGLFYARFSRPTARVVFSNKAIISTYNGKPCLSFRIANERLNQIAEARISLHMTRNEITQEGEHTRKFYELKLERQHSPLFALSWTVRHFIDEHSPLHEMDLEKMRQAQMGLLASLTGVDETFAAPIMARHAYSLEDVVFNKRFKDIILWQGYKVHIDLKGIHDVVDLQVVR